MSKRKWWETPEPHMTDGQAESKRGTRLDYALKLTHEALSIRQEFAREEATEAQKRIDEETAQRDRMFDLANKTGGQVDALEKATTMLRQAGLTGNE